MKFQNQYFGLSESDKMIPMKIIILLVAAFASFGGIYTTINHYTDDNRSQEITVLMPEEDYFHQQVIERAVGVNNSVTALSLGKENPGNTMSLVTGEAMWTTHDTDYNQEEREINERYKNYLNVAYNATQHIERKYPESQINQDLKNLYKAKSLI
jgi:uncharacterized membrane protein